jgi:hypothetical protein
MEPSRPVPLSLSLLLLLLGGLSLLAAPGRGAPGPRSPTPGLAFLGSSHLDRPGTAVSPELRGLEVQETSPPPSPRLTGPKHSRCFKDESFHFPNTPSSGPSPSHPAKEVRTPPWAMGGGGESTLRLWCSFSYCPSHSGVLLLDRVGGGCYAHLADGQIETRVWGNHL